MLNWEEWEAQQEEQEDRAFKEEENARIFFEKLEQWETFENMLQDLKNDPKVPTLETIQKLFENVKKCNLIMNFDDFVDKFWTEFSHIKQ